MRGGKSVNSSGKSGLFSAELLLCGAACAPRGRWLRGIAAAKQGKQGPISREKLQIFSSRFFAAGQIATSPRAATQQNAPAQNATTTKSFGKIAPRCEIGGPIVSHSRSARSATYCLPSARRATASRPCSDPVRV